MASKLGPQFDIGNLLDEGASATAENLARWRPRKGDAGWPPAPEIIGGALARWGALLHASYKMHELGLDVQSARVLEVGAGYGDGLRPFLLAGFMPRNLTGVDLMPERVRICQERLPGVNFVHGDASNMRDLFRDASFDVVGEEFCFCHIPDMGVKERIAEELLRVVKPHGFIFIHNWRMNAPTRGIHGMPQSVIQRMFKVGLATKRVAVFPSHLWPPIGNVISRVMPSLYQVAYLLPFLVGSRLTILQKV